MTLDRQLDGLVHGGLSLCIVLVVNKFRQERKEESVEGQRKENDGPFLVACSLWLVVSNGGRWDRQTIGMSLNSEKERKNKYRLLKLCVLFCVSGQLKKQQAGGQKTDRQTS